jgi:toxin CptA
MLNLVLRPSRALCVVLTLAHIAAGVILIPLDIPGWTKLATLAAIAGSLVHALWRHALLRSGASVVEIQFLGEDRAALRARSGARHQARILGTTYVSPLLTTINLQVAGCAFRRHVLIVPDNADTDAFRQLRLLLRWAYRSSSRGAVLPKRGY